MLPTAIFWPMIAHFLLVCIVYAVLGVRRQQALRSGEAKSSTFRSRGTEPAVSAAASANLMNQFEAPMLFHVVCLALFATNGVSYIAVVLAWIFIALRYFHAFMHLGPNQVKIRYGAFALSLVVLAAIWIYLALHIA